MSFTKQHADENKRMAATAAAVLRDYDVNDWTKPNAHNAVLKALSAEFPHINRARIRNHAARALRRWRGEYVAQHGAPVGNDYAAKGGVTVLVRAYVDSAESAELIRAMTTSERGRALTLAARKSA